MLNKTPKTTKFRYKVVLQWLLIGLLTTSTTLPGRATTVAVSKEEPDISQDINTDDEIETVEQKEIKENTEDSTFLEELPQAKREEISANIDNEENNMKAVDDIASGTFGTSEWRIDSANILHIGKGEFSTSSGASPWKNYSDNIEKIVFEGPVMANANSSFLFSGLSRVQTFENLLLLNTSNVTNMGNMFSDMSSLLFIDTSNFDTSKVTSLQNLFARSSSLVNIDLSSFDTSNVTGMNGMFNGMSSLTVLDLSSFDMTKVTNTTSMFWQTSSLSQITLGKLFKFGASLQTITSSEDYTGKWINISSGSIENPLGENIWTSAEMSANYNGVTDADTYVWQRRNYSGQVVVKYVDESGVEIADEETLTGNIGTSYSSIQKDIEGYTFKEVKDSNATGVFANQLQTVTYIYTKNPVAGGDVTVRYVDESGESIADEATLQGNIGEEYESVQKDIDGYTFKEVKDDNATGTFTDKPQTVTYIYTKDPVIAEDLSHITVHDSSIKVGEDWSPEDNFDEATDFEGNVENFSDIIVEGTVDTQKAATYEVTYTIPEEDWSKSALVEGVYTATAKIVVSEEDAETDNLGSGFPKPKDDTEVSKQGNSTPNDVNLIPEQKSKGETKALPQTGEHFSALTFMAGLALLVLGSIFAVLRFKKTK